MPDKPTRLLLLSGASLVGQNVLAALRDVRSTLHLSAINSVAAEPALFDFDEVYLAGNLRDDPGSFTQRFTEVLAAADPDLVIPCRDDDVAFLARFAEGRPETPTRFLCGAYEPAAAMLDKASSLRFSERHGLPYVPTIDAEGDPASLPAFAAEHGFPLVAKPRRGFASRGVLLILDAAQLERVAGRPDYIVQKYLGDAESVLSHARRLVTEGMPLFQTFERTNHSLQTFIAPDGRIVGRFATRNTMRQGRSERVVKDADPDLEQLGLECARAFSAQGWRGPLNVQCQRTPAGEAMIYEYNGRFTGATSARHLLGYDEVGIALETFCGLARPAGRARDACPVEVVRLPQSRAIDPERVDQLARTGHWSASS